MRLVKLRVREVAQAKGFNLSRLQRRSGLTMGMIRRYWYNETTQVSLDALGTLAHLLEVKSGELLIDEAETEKVFAPDASVGREVQNGSRQSG